MTAAPAEPQQPDDQTVKVQGYHDGQSYALVIDPAQKDPDYGVVADSTDQRLVAKISAHAGELHPPLHPTDGAVPIGLDTVEGALAGLHALTEVTSVTGNLPESLTEDVPSSEVVY
jgi:hypothetical protein